MEIYEYPDLIVINEQEHQAFRNMNDGVVIIPYTSELNVNIGDDITLKYDQMEIRLNVINISFHKNITQMVGTDHPHSAVLKVKM